MTTLHLVLDLEYDHALDGSGIDLGSDAVFNQEVIAAGTHMRMVLGGLYVRFILNLARRRLAVSSSLSGVFWLFFTKPQRCGRTRSKRTRGRSRPVSKSAIPTGGPYLAHQGHPQRPAVLYDLEVLPDDPPLLGRHLMQPVAYRLVACVGAVEYDGEVCHRR